MAKILIAEDERDIRDLIVFILSFAGHQVIPTRNGEEACQKAFESTPDLILLDIRMPGMSGYDVYRNVKAHQRTKDIPVAFLTAISQQNQSNADIKLSAEEYIMKPFSPDELTARVDAILSKNNK